MNEAEQSQYAAERAHRELTEIVITDQNNKVMHYISQGLVTGNWRVFDSHRLHMRSYPTKEQAIASVTQIVWE